MIRSPMCRVIADATAENYGIPLTDLLSERRSPPMAVEARMVAMYLCRHITPYSLPRIGRFFDRDHTTVMHAIRTVERRMQDSAYRERVEQAKARLT